MKTIFELSRNIDIKMSNLSLYDLALTHPSYNADAKTKHHDYERLEYMGDAVIGFVTADVIFKLHPQMDQGNMSKLRSMLVKTDSLANYARRFNLAEYIKAGKSMTVEQVSKSNKILEDIFEALVGAIYLDQGITTAARFVRSFVYEDAKKIDISLLTDAKTKLQEDMQSEYRDSVQYVVIEQTGPAHDRTYKVNVMFNGIVLGTGSGKSKKQAEEAAASDALKKRSV